MSTGSVRPRLLYVERLWLCALAAAQMRVKLGPLLPKPPCFGAATVSLMGYPQLDFALEAVNGARLPCRARISFRHAAAA